VTNLYPHKKRHTAFGRVVCTWIFSKEYIFG